MLFGRRLPKSSRPTIFDVLSPHTCCALGSNGASRSALMKHRRASPASGSAPQPCSGGALGLHLNRTLAPHLQKGCCRAARPPGAPHQLWPIAGPSRWPPSKELEVGRQLFFSPTSTAERNANSNI